MKKIIRICSTCHKNFILSYWQPKKSVEYCSRDCFGKSRITPPKKCPQCGKLFKHPKNGWRDKCCSAKCRYKYFSGNRHGHWKGGIHKNTNGYLRSGVSFQYIHRKIMSEFLGRPLLRKEIVHHINFDKTDNRIENLKIMSISKHNRLHHAGKKHHTCKDIAKA